MRQLLRPRNRSAQRIQAPRPYVGEPLVCLEDTDAGPLWIPASDGVMRPYLQEFKTWEPLEGRLMSRFFKPGLRFLDVGANIGYFSLFVAKNVPDAVIHAFEPHPLTSSILALNAWSTGADITTHAMALSDGDRMLALSTAPTNLGDTRTHAVGTADMITPAAPLDDVLPDAQFDLVKIDVQGYEPEVISGMMGMIASSPGVMIIAEFAPENARERAQDPRSVLNGYRELGLDIRVQVENDVMRMDPVDIVRTCDQAGPAGQVNLILTKG